LPYDNLHYKNTCTGIYILGIVFELTLLQHSIQINLNRFGLVNQSPMAKRILASFPVLLKMMKPKGAMVVNVGADGKIRRILDDSDEKVLSFVTSAVEFEGNLFLGSLANNFVGKLSLK
jgi:hypothetical protein